MRRTESSLPPIAYTFRPNLVKPSTAAVATTARISTQALNESEAFSPSAMPRVESFTMRGSSTGMAFRSMTNPRPRRRNIPARVTMNAGAL